MGPIQPRTVSVAFAHDHHVGADDARRTLEDASEATPVRLTDGQLVTLGMIADGMGGLEGGEIASRTAVETVLSYLRSGNPSNLPALMQGALQDAHQRVMGRRKELDFHGMGTTATVAVVASDGRLYLAHVGDSRAYLLRDGYLFQLTLDHLWGEEQVRAGKLSAEEAAVHDRRDALNRYIGQADSLNVDMGIWLSRGKETRLEAEARQGFQLVEGDTILLCSDGLTKELPNRRDAHFVENDDIVRIVGSHTPHEAIKQLIALALRHNVDDNVSVVVLHIQPQSMLGQASPTVSPASAGAISKREVMERVADSSAVAPPDPPAAAAPLPAESAPVPAGPALPQAIPAPVPGRARRRSRLPLILLLISAVLILAVIYIGFIAPAFGPPAEPAVTLVDAPDIPASLIGTARYTTGGDPVALVDGAQIPGDRHVVLSVDVGSRVRLALADGVVLYVGDEVSEIWLTPNPNAGQDDAPSTMVRLISGRLLVSAWESDRDGFLLYTSTELPWIALEGGTLGVRRIVNRAAGIEETTLECLDGACQVLTAPQVSAAACQRVKIAGGEAIPPTPITANNWGALAGSDIPPSLLCGQ